MNREQILCRRVRLLTGLFIVGLILSGATAIPLVDETRLLVRILGADHGSTGWVAGNGTHVLGALEGAGCGAVLLAQAALELRDGFVFVLLHSNRAAAGRAAQTR